MVGCLDHGLEGFAQDWLGLCLHARSVHDVCKDLGHLDYGHVDWLGLKQTLVVSLTVVLGRFHFEGPFLWVEVKYPALNGTVDEEIIQLLRQWCQRSILLGTLLHSIGVVELSQGFLLKVK